MQCQLDIGPNGVRYFDENNRPKESGLSRGHLAFIGTWEYFETSSEVYRAPIKNPIRVDVPIRNGARWEGPASMKETILKLAKDAWA